MAKPVSIKQRIQDLELHNRALTEKIEALANENAEIKNVQRILAYKLADLTQDRSEPNFIEIMRTKQ